MHWIKLTLHFPSFFSYRMPDYSSQYALSVPLPSPSSIKLGMVATAIRTSGNVSEGEKVFNIIKDADILVSPPENISINSFLIKRLKKKKNQPGFEKTFGIREFVFLPEDIDIFIGGADIAKIASYFGMLRYIGSSDSLVYVRNVNKTNNIPEGVIRAIGIDEFVKNVNKDSCLIYPVKDINKNTTFEQINPYSSKSGRKILDQKYYLINAKLKKGKNWKLLEFKKEVPLKISTE